MVFPLDGFINGFVATVMFEKSTISKWKQTLRVLTLGYCGRSAKNDDDSNTTNEKSQTGTTQTSYRDILSRQNGV